MLLRGFGVIALAVGSLLCLVLDAFESFTWLWMLSAFSLGTLVVLILLAFLYLVLICKIVDYEKEQSEDSRHYRRVLETYIESALPALRIKVTAEGLAQVPTDRRFMLVCNHCSNIDPVILCGQFAGQQVSFISKKENRDLFLVGKMMHKLQCQLIDRENDREALKTILKCIQMLKEDRCSIGVFPEGYIHPDRKLHNFRPGVFKIAQKANVPIVVCTLTNTAQSISRLLKLKPSHIHLTVLKVIDPAELKGRKTVEISDEIYAMMAENLGPENVTTE